MSISFGKKFQIKYIKAILVSVKQLKNNGALRLPYFFWYKKSLQGFEF